MTCKKCGKENKNTNIKCEFCGNQLIDIKKDKEKINQTSIKNTYIELILISLITYIIIIVFTSSLIIEGYSNTTAQNNATKNYLETEAKLLDVTNCSYDDGDELCLATYEYKVKGKTYYAYPNYLWSKSKYKDVLIVKYNPDNPSEYVLDPRVDSLLVVGIGFLTMFTIVFIPMIIFLIVLIKRQKRLK